jgi:hypothetical protein
VGQTGGVSAEVIAFPRRPTRHSAARAPTGRAWLSPSFLGWHGRAVLAVLLAGMAVASLCI